MDELRVTAKLVAVPAVTLWLVGLKPSEKVAGTWYTKCSPDPEVPPEVVAFTVTVPAAWAGELTLTWEALTKVTEAAGMTVPPTVTVVAPETKPVPVRVSEVPPAVGPALGVTLVMVGPVTYVKCSPEPEVPPAVVAFTVTVPAAWAGATATIVAGEVTVQLRAVVVANLTFETPVPKPVPVRVTEVPPALGPALGVTLVIVGAAS